MYVYFTPLVGIFTIVSLFMLLGGNLFAMYKMHVNTLKHAEKCGCCGGEKRRREESTRTSCRESRVTHQIRPRPQIAAFFILEAEKRKGRGEV